MRLWTAVHLGISPTATKKINDWQIGLIYEMAMSYPIDGLREWYFKDKKSVSHVDEDKLKELGYTPEMIAKIKGKK
jgi:ethanolamine ammonia-lyase large subunit